MKFLSSVVLGVCLLVAGVASAQPAPIAESFSRHRSVLSCPGATAAHDYEQCAFEFMRRVACEHQGTIALFPKSGGTFCTHNGRGYDCDKLVILASGEMYDIVSGAGVASQSPAWLLADTGVFSGTVPAPSCASDPPPPPPSGVPIAEAANTVLTAFQAAQHREPTSTEINLIGSWATQLGWNGSNHIASAIVGSLVDRVQQYSGNPANPFPAVDPDEALRQLNERWQARFGRDVHPVELNAIVQYALTRWNGQGNVPLWLLDEILALSDTYDGSLAPTPIDPLAQPAIDGVAFTLDDGPFEWRGSTAFLLAYDWFHRPAQYRAFRDAMVADKRNVMRVSVATSTGYLTLRPRSGGTFGQGWTTPLYPGSVPNFWPRYRAMLLDLAAHGILAEVVPFLTAGPPHTRGNGEPSQGDTSVPQMQTAALRMAYLQETARELLPIRAKFVEMANEYNHIGFALDGGEIVALWNAYKAIDPDALVARSAPYDGLGIGSNPASQLLASGDYSTLRISRQTTPRTWQWVLDKLVIPQIPYGRPAVDDEAINADTVGEFGNDATPANHWANAILVRLTPGLYYTFHFDRALKGLAPAVHDGSLGALQASQQGESLVPINVQGQFFAYRNILGADAAVARLGESDGWLLLIGATVEPSVPGWTATLAGAHGPHRFYRLTPQ